MKLRIGLRYFSVPATTTLLIVIGAGLAACSREAATPWPENVVPSDLLAPHVQNSLELLQSPNSGDPNVVSDLLLYEQIRQGLYDGRSRRPATMQLHEVWNSNPAHPLWPELALLEWRSLDDYKLVFETYDDPVCTDSTTAVGIYASTWRTLGSKDMVARFDMARERSAELDPFFQFWITFSLAYSHWYVEQYERSVEMNLDLLPAARALGGPCLESIVWSRILRGSMDRGDLDDALIAAVLADTLSASANDILFRRLDTRWWRANVLATRRDSREAFALYESNTQAALESNLAFSASANLNRAGTLADAIGDPSRALEYDLRGLEFALADADSANIPPHMANIANGYRLIGELDSCRAYLSRAETWVDADPYPYNVARLALFQAKYYAEIGAYGVVDSLLAAAETLSDEFRSTKARAELYTELIQGWMQVGRPNLVYRLIESSSEFRSGVADTDADRNVTADLNLLIAEFYTRQSQFSLASESLDLAAAALEGKENLQKLWMLARNRGLLDRARGNLSGAEKWFQECIRLTQGRRYADLSATGHLLAGSVRLEAGDYAGAREALPSDELESSLDTRILALLLTGVSHLREGHADLALGFLNEAHAKCRSWTPLDLIGRVELEIGRAQAATGSSRAALDYYERVAERIHDSDFGSQSTEDLAYFTGDLRRDLVEARLGLEQDDPRASLEFAMDLLPRWRPIDSDLRTSQVIYFVGDEFSARWIVHESGMTFTRLVGSSEIVTLLRPVRADLGVPGSAISAASVDSLSNLLLGGISEFWGESETVHLVPDLALSGVPWAALSLPGTEQMLVERGPIVVLDRPTGRVGARIRTGDDLLIIAAESGNAAGLEQLRHVQQEAEAVGNTWSTGEVDLRSGPAAADALAEGVDLTPYRAIHVASHAVVYTGRADQTTLLLDGDANKSGTVSHIRDLEIAADLVFLSACKAGGGGGTRSVHAGLARSFQDAGAGHVIAPISVIDDEAAREFAVSFYRHWNSDTPVADALRAAQLEQRSGERSHPFYWAFYQVFGGGGTN